MVKCHGRETSLSIGPLPPTTTTQYIYSQVRAVVSTNDMSLTCSGKGCPFKESSILTLEHFKTFVTHHGNLHLNIEPYTTGPGTTDSDVINDLM